MTSIYNFYCGALQTITSYATLNLCLAHDGYYDMLEVNIQAECGH